MESAAGAGRRRACQLYSVYWLYQFTSTNTDRDRGLLQEQAAGALRNFAVNPANKGRIVDEGGMLPLVALLRSSDKRVQEQAAGAIRNLATDDNIKVKSPHLYSPSHPISTHLGQVTASILTYSHLRPRMLRMLTYAQLGD